MNDNDDDDDLMMMTMKMKMFVTVGGLSTWDPFSSPPD